MVTSWKRMILTAGVTLAFFPVAIFAQARSRYKWKTPSVSSIRTVGGDFSTYSSGIGGLKRSGTGAPTGILSSSLISNYNLRHGTAGAGAGALGTSLPKLTGLKGRTYGSTKITLPVTMGDSGRPKGALTGAGRIATTSDIRSKLSSKTGRTTTTTSTTSTTKPREPKPIASFVPNEPSRYQKYMQQGEQAFRAERYVEAAEAFDVAIAIGRYLPESHLSLVHAYSAMGRYHSAAYHLRRTLKHFPELPLVSLRVRLFYGRTETFVGQMDKLRQETQEPYAEADLSLLLAYFRYFDGAEADAAKVLRRAWDAGKDDRATAEAVETFWNGMVAAGKAKGALAAATKPAHPAPTGRDRPAGGKQPALLPAVHREPTTAPAADNPTAGKNAQDKGRDKK